MSGTNNPFTSTRLNDRDIRVLRSASTRQQINEDLPLAVQYVKYEETDFFAVSFNRALQTEVVKYVAPAFDFYNLSVTGSGLTTKDAPADTYFNFSQSAAFGHIRDFFYRQDPNIEDFTRAGTWVNSITSSYFDQWPESESGQLEALTITASPLWIRNKRDGTSAEINSVQLTAGPSGITPFIKAMAIKPEYSRDEIERGTFALNVLDQNIISLANYQNADNVYVWNPPKALTFNPSFKDTAVSFDHPSSKLDAFNAFAGSGFTVEVIFRPGNIDGQQSLIYKGGVLTCVSGGMTAVTENIYEAGTVAVNAGATALSGDSKFMALSTNTEGVYYEVWQKLSGDSLWAGRHLEPQVNFMGNVMSPMFTEFRIDLLSRTGFEIQVGDGNLLHIVGTTGLAFGLGGNLAGGSGARYYHGGASAAYYSGINGPTFDFEDGKVHHMIVAWSPTGTSHVMSPIFPNTGNAAQEGSYSGHIRAYLDGNKLAPSESLVSAKYHVNELYMADPSTTPEQTMSSMYNHIPPIDFSGGDVHTLDIFTQPDVPWKLLDSQSPPEMEGVFFTWSASAVEDPGGSVTACDDTMGQLGLIDTIHMFDPLTATISAQIVRPGNYLPNMVALSANQIQYLEQVVTLSGGKMPVDWIINENPPYEPGTITGSQFIKLENPDKGFPEETLDEITVELFFRTNADRNGGDLSLCASRTGTIFSIGGVTQSGLYSPKQISLDYVADNPSNTGWPKLRVSLFDEFEQLGENVHELTYFSMNAYPVTSLSASWATDPLAALTGNELPFEGWTGGQPGEIVISPDGEVNLPMYRSTPYLALSYSKNDDTCRLKSSTSLGAFYQMFVKQDIGLSAAQGIVTGDHDEGRKNTLTSLNYFTRVDSNTAQQYYTSRSLNFHLPLEEPELATRHNSAMFLNGVSEALSAAVLGLATSQFCTFEVEEIRIWKKGLTKYEMEEHAKDRNTLFYLDNSVPTLTPKDLISQFTFNQTHGSTNMLVGATPERNICTGLTRRRESMAFPRPNFSSNGRNFSGEILELRGWVGALADPYDSIATTGDVMTAPGYQIFDNVPQEGDSDWSLSATATANEVGLSFKNMGVVKREGRLQRYTQFIDNYLPLCTPRDYANSGGSLTSCVYANKKYDINSRSPKTHSMLAFWYNFDNSINTKLALDNAQDNVLTLYFRCDIRDTGFIQYRDTGLKALNSDLVNHDIRRIAKFGSRTLSFEGEQPSVGIIFNQYNFITFNSSDKYQNGRHEEVNFTNFDQSWDQLQQQIMKVQYNNIIYKAMLQPNTIADGTLFNGSQNPTAYDPVTNEYFSTPPASYITSIGFFNDKNELLAVANIDKPLRKNEDQTIFFKPLLDFSPSQDMLPYIIEETSKADNT